MHMHTVSQNTITDIIDYNLNKDNISFVPFIPGSAGADVR